MLFNLTFVAILVILLNNGILVVFFKKAHIFIIIFTFSIFTKNRRKVKENPLFTKCLIIMK